MDIKIRKSEDKLIVSLEGRLDANNKDEVEAKLSELEIGDLDLVLDIDELSYISSAGLRIVLKLLKDNPDLVVINANTEVYSIFEMTGFTEMLPVKKALRRMSVDGCEVIGKGAKGSVYRIDGDTIIKVYNKADTLPDALRERELARKAFVLGIPTAISYDVVRVGETYGSMFELLDAKSLSKLISENPNDLEKYVKEYSDLLKTIHTTKIDTSDMPNCKIKIQEWLDKDKEVLDENTMTKLQKLVDNVPDTDNMLHFDYHTNNLMMQNGEVLLIDMDTLCYGHPIFELANIFVAYVGLGVVEPKIVEDFIGLSYDMCNKFYKLFLIDYFGTIDVEDFDNKIQLLGYARLLRHTLRRDKDERMVNLTKEKIVSLVQKVDSLEF